MILHDQERTQAAGAPSPHKKCIVFEYMALF